MDETPEYGVYDVLKKLVDLNIREFGNDHQNALDALDKAFGVEHEEVPELPAQSGGTIASAEQVAQSQTSQPAPVATPDPVAAGQIAPPASVLTEVPSFLSPPVDTSPVSGLPATDTTQPPA